MAITPGGNTYRRALHPGLRRAGSVGEDRGTVYSEGRPEGAFNTSRTRQGSFQKQVSEKKKKYSKNSMEVRSVFYQFRAAWSDDGSRPFNFSLGPFTPIFPL